MTYQPQYIFITGIFRSGTTLLARALSAHHDVHVFYQPFTHFFNYTMNKFWEHTLCLQTKAMGDPFLIDKFYKEFMDNVLLIRFNEREIKSIKKVVRQYFAIDSTEKNMDARRAFADASGDTFFELLQSAMNNLRHVGNNKKCAIVGIKEIWCEDFIPAFLEQGDLDIKCFHVLRDPRAVVASRNYGTYLDKGCKGQKYPILFIARSWRRSVQILHKLKGCEDYYPILYEHLVNSPESVVKGICDFLQIEFDPDMLDFGKYKGGDGRPWRGNIDSKKFKGITPEQATEWKATVSKDDVFLCEFLCFKEMQSLGYELTTDCSDVERFLALKEDASAQKSWLCAQNHCLNDEEKAKELQRREEIFEN